MAEQCREPRPETVAPALASLLALDQLEADTFRSRAGEHNGGGSLFGGQVLGQALAAAGRTVGQERAAHSLHAYFLRAGSFTEPVLYRVERQRDGAFFSSRRVVAIQNGRTLFEMLASFQQPLEGIDHQAPIGPVPAPETLLNLQQLLAEHRAQVTDFAADRLGSIRLVEIRPCDPQAYLLEPVQRHHGSYWIRVRETLPADAHVHRCALAYLSDYWLLGAILLPYGRAVIAPQISALSLDHAIWFHRPARVDDWLLYSTDSPSAGAGRGFARGALFDRGGRLVASTAQEGLVRIRRA